ncbi:MAG TPA: SURF1 family cytochrome oxidase biogenesis protein [Rhodopila sp.]|jgi:surfeit locus 1 family protein
MTRGYRRFLVPTLSTLVMLMLLIGLGTWQVYRLHWKERILARIAAAEAAPPVPLPIGPYAPSPYTKISVTGRLRYDQAAQFGAEVRDTRTGPTMGAYQIVPLERNGAPPILVDRGWIPQTRGTPLDDPTGEVTVTGYVRPGETQHWFSPTDDDAGRQFFTLDPAAIGAVVGSPNPEPYVLVAMGPETAGTYPAPAQHLPRPPNNHLSYVITWYGLAVALLIIFGAWVRKALRS